MKDLYSSIASSYSSLVKLIFGQGLFLAKTHFLVPSKFKKILIIGGGDGQDYKSFATELNGSYWELSESMLALAKKNLIKSELEFHLGDFGGSDQKRYDEVWLHFVLDTMPDADFMIFIAQVKTHLMPQGNVHIADFSSPKTLWQKILHAGMLQFFRILTAHPRKDLPANNPLMKSAGFELLKEMKWEKGWILSQVWRIKDSSPQLSG